MLGEFLPEHEKPANPGGNRVAQQWLSPEFMERFSEIPDNRRKELRKGAGDIALGLSEQQPGLSQQEGDIVESVAPLLIAAFPTSPVALAVTADVVAVGSPYDKENQKKAA